MMQAMREMLDGRMKGGAHLYPLKVQYEDTDMGGIVYHARYLAFAERGRSAMLRCAGIDQNAMLAGGDIFAVHRLKIKYAAPARLGDCLVVTTTLSAMRASVMVLEQVISVMDDGGGKVLARLFVDIALISTGGKPRRIPADMQERIIKTGLSP